MVKATREDQNIFVKGNPRSDQVKYVDLEGYVRNISPFKIVQDVKTGQPVYQTVCNMMMREKAKISVNAIIIIAGEKNEAKYVPTEVIMRTTEPPLFLLNPNTKLELFGYYFSKRDNPDEKMFRAVRATTVVFDKSEPAKDEDIKFDPSEFETVPEKTEPKTVAAETAAPEKPKRESAPKRVEKEPDTDIMIDLEDISDR